MTNLDNTQKPQNESHRLNIWQSQQYAREQAVLNRWCTNVRRVGAGIR